MSRSLSIMSKTGRNDHGDPVGCVPACAIQFYKSPPALVTQHKYAVLRFETVAEYRSGYNIRRSTTAEVIFLQRFPAQGLLQNLRRIRRFREFRGRKPVNLFANAGILPREDRRSLHDVRDV